MALKSKYSRIYIQCWSVARAGNKNIERSTSLIKLAFLVFQTLTLNFGPFKSTLSIPSHRMTFLGTADEMPICQYTYVERGFIKLRDMK